MLRRAGLLAGVAAVDWVGRVDAPPGLGEVDAVTGVLNGVHIRDYSRVLAAALEARLEPGRLTLVLGGDCSVLVGVALALRRRGCYGLAFLDGHADFYSPSTEPTAEVASMELAIVSGAGPAALADIDGLSPYLREQDVVLLGTRDLEAVTAEGSPDVRETGMRVIDLREVRRLGADQSASQALERLTGAGLDGFWIHLDADVLDDAVMPAVDYRLRGGLVADELSGILAALLASRRAVGLSVTIYNPELDDESLSAGRVLAQVVNQAVVGTGATPGAFHDQ